MGRKEKVVKTYDVFYCKACGGFIKEINEDEKIFRNTQRYLNSVGDYEWGTSEDYDGETTAIECFTCHTEVKTFTFDATVWEILKQRLVVEGEDIFPCSMPADETELVTEKILFSLLL